METYLDLKVAAERLGVCTATLRLAIKKGTLTALKRSNRYIVLQAWLDAWKENQTTLVNPDAATVKEK